jgi:tRNA A37 threonylcarbamoyladenosine dehydratase
LARSGVSKLRLIDFDQVTLSSLNRHSVATLADVGISKVRCLERRLVAITPWARFDLRQEKFDGQVAARLLEPWEDGQQPDFIVDAIDNIDTKVELLKYCHDHKLPVISSMGAGCKSDPTRIIVGDISTTTDDGLSRATRRRLKLQGVSTGIPTVFSTERSGDNKAELLPLPEEEFAKGPVDDLGPMARFRVRILPVLGTMPAIFGITIANHVILSITGYPTDYVPAKGRERMYEGMLNAVKSVEDKLASRFHPGLVGLKLPITSSDIGLLADDLYHGRSIITGLSTRLVFIRWEKPEQSTVNFIGEGKDSQKSCIIKLNDLVCMTKEEAARHEKSILTEGKSLEELYDTDTIVKVEERRKEVALYEKFRV